MATMIKGITVNLYEMQETDTNAFNEAIYAPVKHSVANVLVTPATEQEILDTVNLTGRRAVYTLCIPKGDAHDWTNQIVEFFGRKWRTIGEPIEWIEAMVPLDWNMKVRVESFVDVPELPDPPSL